MYVVTVSIEDLIANCWVMVVYDLGEEFSGQFLYTVFIVFDLKVLMDDIITDITGVICDNSKYFALKNFYFLSVGFGSEVPNLSCVDEDGSNELFVECDFVVER
ncbi:hypothetical protein AVEN_225325-1 [Araneus ventricosus]|uniref:Uncharacterized protein n=1 Tax=Araneus ventricosus TaxID=182803 RepID=A0A4Y2AL91_ARAVE|nr:hypothetical protein AVEN_225325-1 [Araneus ventricosus]